MYDIETRAWSAAQALTPHNAAWLAGLSSEELERRLTEAQHEGMKAAYDADAQRHWRRAEMYQGELERRAASGITREEDWADSSYTDEEMDEMESDELLTT